MKVKDLIKLLEGFPKNAKLGKVSLSDDTGESDSKMTPEDWDISEVEDPFTEKPTGKHYVYCSFGNLLNEEEQ